MRDTFWLLVTFACQAHVPAMDCDHTNALITMPVRQVETVDECLAAGRAHSMVFLESDFYGADAVVRCMYVSAPKDPA